jgi:uncharacterized damage-inducible protein DinB
MHSYSKQFQFEHWSNSLILDALKNLKEESPRALYLFSHLINSHSMWLSRVTKTELKVALFEERSLEENALLMQENLEGWSKYLFNKSMADLLEEIEFMAAWEANPSKRKIKIEDAIIHLINHSSYHRGQIISM